jgi:hypothetical protein
MKLERLFKLDKNIIIKFEYEISRIDKLISEAKPLLDLCKIREPDFIEITAAAQILHSFYNGIESVVIMLFKYANEKLPNDIKWHKTLFEMMFGQNTKCIKILNIDIKEKLYEYLLFRHSIRHSYSSEISWDEMKPLTNELEEVWKIIKNDFEMYIKLNTQ